MGWIGTPDQLVHTLRTYGVDCDEESRPIVGGGIFRGLGGGDVVIDDSAVCYIDGKAVNIAGLLKTTSYGVNLTVIS